MEIFDYLNSLLVRLIQSDGAVESSKGSIQVQYAAKNKGQLKFSPLCKQLNWTAAQLTFELSWIKFKVRQQFPCVPANG